MGGSSREKWFCFLFSSVRVGEMDLPRGLIGHWWWWCLMGVFHEADGSCPYQVVLSYFDLN